MENRPRPSTRRGLLKQLGAFPLALFGVAEGKVPPVRAITRGPKFPHGGSGRQLYLIDVSEIVS